MFVVSFALQEKADRYYEDTVRDDRLTPKVGIALINWLSASWRM